MTGKRFPRAIRNNNPFNIKQGMNNWIGAKPAVCCSDKVFEEFKEIRFGLRAGQKLLLNYIFLNKVETIYDIINRFAPSTENHTANYVDFCCKDKNGKTIYNEDTKIDTLEKFLHLCYRICKFETGLSEIGCENLRLTPYGQKEIYDTYFNLPNKYFNHE